MDNPKKFEDLPIAYSPYMLDKRTLGQPGHMVGGPPSHALREAQNPNLITDVIPNDELKPGQPKYSTPSIQWCGTLDEFDKKIAADRDKKLGR